VIVEILGKHGDPEIDTISMIHEYHFRSEFAEEVIENARQVVKAHDYEAELPHRDDLRGETIVTIDPDEAKDFDDAISLTKTSEGRIELGVHIADVSQFVQKGSPLDEEASLRGNSIYFPRHVIPMLPEILSNGLCSLQEDQPRMAKSAFIRYDKNAKRVSARFANSVIQSTKRLTYQEATNIIEGKTGGFEPEVVDLVQRMETLARKIRKRRLADGMIVLDLPEVELEIDDEDRVTGVVPADTSFSHTIIEMFMVEANEVVAELFNNLNVPHIRRIHPDPPEDAQAGLSRLLRVLGKPVPETLEREDMIRLLASVKGQPESVAVNMAILRSMSQAEYSPKLIGHFALASRHYSHFTSPIRRYPDLVIHRLLQDYLDGKLDTKAGKEACPSSETLTDIGKRCSYTERRAEAAERELRQIKILRFLENHLGEIEEGVVTGVTNVGVFVQLRKYLIDGLVRFSDLPDDWWDVDAKAGCMVGQQSGTRVAIGDFVKVELAGVDVMSRELDLIIVEHRPSSRSTSGPNKRGERKSGANDRTSKRRRGGPKAAKGGRRGDRRGREQSSSRKKVKRGKPKSSRRRR
jgi:ribonuclease R